MGEQKKLVCNAQFNSIQTNNEDISLMDIKMIIHDFDKSWNEAIISKEVAENNIQTLINKPICCQYFTKENNNGLDALGGHGVEIQFDRDSDEPFIATNTLNIGVITNSYIDTITDRDGNEKEVVMADGVLWCDKYPNIISLIDSWISQGLEVNSSVELLYSNYEVKDNVQYINNPIIYTGHCILNSQDRGEKHPKVLPAYDISRIISMNEWQSFNKLVAEAIRQEKGVSDSMDKFKKVFELSHSDIRSKIYQAFDVTLGENEWSYICDVYDDYFIINVYGEITGDKYYKLEYTKEESSVTINFESKVEVVEERKWVELAEVQTLQNQIIELNGQLETIQTQLNEANASIETLKTEKETVTTQFNDATEKLTLLNGEVEVLKPFKEKYETEQIEKIINEKIEYYAPKFKAVNAKEKFESEDVQNLIKLSVNETEEGKNAILQLNTMLVDLVQVKTEDNHIVREFSSKQENLLPTSTDFDSRYGA